jgi:hypothetical protein
MADASNYCQVYLFGENPLLGAAFLFWGNPRIKKRQDRGAQRAGWVDLRYPPTAHQALIRINLVNFRVFGIGN